MWDDKKSSHKSSDVNEVNKGGRPKGSVGVTRDKRKTLYFTKEEIGTVDQFFSDQSVTLPKFARDASIAMAKNPELAKKIMALVYPNSI